MSTYQTDEEQVEAIKKWWSENGKSVIGGVVLGFAIIGGWQGWDRYQKSEGEQASSSFEVMMEHSIKGETDGVVKAGQDIVATYPNTAYGFFAASELAKVVYEKGEVDAAKAHLQSAIDIAPDDSLASMAKLRFAALALDSGDFAGAKQVLEGINDPAYQGEAETLKGDIALAEGDKAAAVAAYKAALAAGVRDRKLVRMKLIDAGGEA